MRQSLNQAMLGRQALATTNTLNATPTGSTDTSVLRFNALPAVPLGGNAFTVTNTAAAGTVVSITEPGYYQVSLSFVLVGAVAIAAGISVGATAFPITADPVVNVAGVVASADVVGVGALTMPVQLDVTFILRQTAIDGIGSDVRFHATNSAGAAPVGITAASAQYRIEKLAQVYR